MNTSDRITQYFKTSGLPVWDIEKKHINRYVSVMQGDDLAAAIVHAMHMQTRLATTINVMKNILDFGETSREESARLQRENMTPEIGARRYGWMPIEEFAQLCDKSDTGFYKRISSVKGRIVKPESHKWDRLLGNEWDRYEQRCEYWADHFRVANNWEEALKMSREEEVRERDSRFAEL